MGQYFQPTAYDIETKTCCTINGYRFFSTCYNDSKEVRAMHYLLRQKPYRIMWCGDDVLSEHELQSFSTKEDLLALSAFRDDFEWLEEYEKDNKVYRNKEHFDKLKQIKSYSEEWTRLDDKDISNKALKYFDFENTKSVHYSDYLINHTKKLAIDLRLYWENSVVTFCGLRRLVCIDLLPVLTEPTGSPVMFGFRGMTSETTKSLISTWPGDLLQIVDEVPQEYEQINCCFVNLVDCNGKAI